MILDDTRHRAVVHYKHFERSLRRVSKLYGISKSSLQRWVKASPCNCRSPRKPFKVREEVDRTVRSFLDANPFATMLELSHHLSGSCGIRKSPRTACRYTDTEMVGYTRKKAYRAITRAPTHASNVQRFCEGYPMTSEDCIICIDEAGFYIGDACRYGYAKKGRRLQVQTSRTLRRAKLTLIAAVGTQGIVAYQVLSRKCKKLDFVDFVNNLPDEKVSGKMAVLDNIRFHHSKDTLEAFRKKRLTPLFTPPYSPELNAIESVFGAVKGSYRRQCPLVDTEKFDYRGLLERVLENFTEVNLKRYFNHVSRIVESVRKRLHANTEDPLLDIGYAS